MRITINTGDAAFEGQNKEIEVSRILKELAQEIEHKGIRKYLLRDINGNRVGYMEVE